MLIKRSELDRVRLPIKSETRLPIEAKKQARFINKRTDRHDLEKMVLVSAKNVDVILEQAP